MCWFFGEEALVLNARTTLTQLYAVSLLAFVEDAVVKLLSLSVNVVNKL